jgi:hypothetical protein
LCLFKFQFLIVKHYPLCYFKPLFLLISGAGEAALDLPMNCPGLCGHTDLSDFLAACFTQPLF